MLYGFKYWKDGVLHMQVEGYRYMTFVFYTERQAVKEYRRMFHLELRKIVWHS